MLLQRVHNPRPSAPVHLPGEVAWVTLGNYLESGPRCRSKMRPAIILQPCGGQHVIAGLTTRATTIDGRPRPRILTPENLGLDARPSFLWSSRPSYLSRLDVRYHAGWIDFDTAELIVRHMNLAAFIYADLLRAAAHARRLPALPR